MQVTAILKDWKYDPSWKVYYGRIYGDTKERWPDGTKIHTSHVVSQHDCDIHEGYTLVQTLNSVYALRAEDARKPKEASESKSYHPTGM